MKSPLQANKEDWSDHLMSVKVHIANNSLVTERVRPHEVVYTTDGKAAVYNEISMPLFVQGYLIVMEEEKQAVRAQMSVHLKDLMGMYNCMDGRKYTLIMWCGSTN